MDRVRLAIVIPYYKIDFFEHTLESIALQTDKRFKLYIGNDASPYDPQEMIAKWLVNTDYVYKSYSDNFGGECLVKQWERILEDVEEEWVQILGDDDTIAPNFVESFYNHVDTAQSLGCLVLRYKYFKIDSNGLVLKTFSTDEQVSDVQFFMNEKLNWRDGSSLSENVFRLDKWKKYKFTKFPLAWHSDDYALLEFSEYGQFYNIQDSFVSVRLSEQSITGQDSLSAEKSYATYLFYEKLVSQLHKITYSAFFDTILDNYLYSCRKEKKYPSKALRFDVLKRLTLKRLLSLGKSYFDVYTSAKAVN